ncbi:hypothetical protein CVT24_007432 [Panaeolus cyanescens]|uniref:GATA-type domain-containing protein n=1 Tax=Panaeolus cyanescens TaxID=181874 RepID=A0A409W9T4_9AGAR|nr:hypothetical protein CVT24_007432 [Panaeolus cyanescens]
MTEITNHCSVLYQFANRWVQLQSTSPQLQPTHSELKEMSDRAMEVVRLLEQLRGVTNAQEPEQPRIPQDVIMQGSPDSARPPKRPWEDISEDEPSSMSDPNGFNEQSPPQQAQQPVQQAQPQAPSQYAGPDSKPQTTAEQDMELIRTKRATSTAGANGNAGHQKSKYRKRSRATPPGKCHSCNIRETPEWRRGPDGARTLCNACGLHYAKLMRKRDKAGPNGEPQHIDLETLRASARAAETADKASRSNKQSSSRSHQPEPASPMDSVKQTPQLQHHQGSFQLVNMMAPDPTSTSSIPTPQQQPAQPPQTSQQQQQQPQQTQPPPQAPPTSITPSQTQWATAPPPSRMYSSNDHIQHQSFMRTSQHGSR